MDKKKSVLQTVKYYKPSRGGMESVVESIVDGISSKSNNYTFSVYSNTHEISFLSKKYVDKNNRIIKEATPILLKSQPVNLVYLELKRLIMESDIIHHHYPFPTMEIALLSNWNLLQRKKLIITWHANIQNSRWSNIGKFYNPIIERLLSLASYIVVTSPQLLDNSTLLKKYSNKVKVIPLSYDNSFNLEEMNVRSIKDKKVKKILFVGRLRKYKGVCFLIDALKGMSGVELTIVGEGEEEIYLKKQADVNLMNESVRFLKNIDNNELRKLYQEADLFVLPSINEAEAFGVVQLEALSNGLPVINTKLNSGVPFVSLDNETGFTVSPSNSEALKDAINKIFGDEELYNRFSRNALERVKDFSIDKLVESYTGLYEN